MPRARKDIPQLAWRDGVAYVFWYDTAACHTKRISLRTRDSGEAQARFAAFLTEGDAIFAPRQGLTVEQALDDYRREHVALHCADPRRQEDAIIHLKSFFGDRPLDAVDIPTSRKYADARRKGIIGVESRRSGKSRCASDGTIRRELNVLVAASNHAKAWKRVSDMPSIELPTVRLLGVDDEAPFFTRDELSLLMADVDGELRHFVTLAYWTGARRGSIEDLTRAQVRWDQRQIHLQATGKRATKKRQPIVPLLAEMEPALRALWDASQHRERLFLTTDFYRPFRQLCERLGFGGRSNPHMLRHSRATHLLQAGVSLYSVARLLGDTVATIERVYGHHSHENLTRELEGR